MIPLNNHSLHSMSWNRIVNCYKHPLKTDENAHDLAISIFMKNKNRDDLMGVVFERNTNEATLYYGYFKGKNKNLVFKHVDLIDCLFEKTTLYQSKCVLYPAHYELMTKEKFSKNVVEWIKEEDDLVGRARYEIRLIPSSQTEMLIGQFVPLMAPYVRDLFANYSSLFDLSSFSESSFEGILARFVYFEPRVYINESIPSSFCPKLQEASTRLSTFLRPFKIFAYSHNFRQLDEWYKSQTKDGSVKTMRYQGIIIGSLTSFLAPQDKASPPSSKPNKTDKNAFEDVLEGNRLSNEIMMTPNQEVLSYYRLFMGHISFFDLKNKKSIKILRQESDYLYEISRATPDRFEISYRERIHQQFLIAMGRLLPTVLNQSIWDYYGFYGHLPVCPTLEEEM